ncbi:CLUMA_CG020644, isoform A [Clunio marinus]|uniref:CLUMA_CG020644, isoform A n=1 Tax=Clunio marinus TaxID=568069 RepID=A0A1J1J5L9_9DIPT|nr:CLUMA_CG020644, isoform A [Clunio marinus]
MERERKRKLLLIPNTIWNITKVISATTGEECYQNVKITIRERTFTASHCFKKVLKSPLRRFLYLFAYGRSVSIRGIFKIFPSDKHIHKYTHKM